MSLHTHTHTHKHTDRKCNQDIQNCETSCADNEHCNGSPDIHPINNNLEVCVCDSASTTLASRHPNEQLRMLSHCSRHCFLSSVTNKMMVNIYVPPKDVLLPLVVVDITRGCSLHSTLGCRMGWCDGHTVAGNVRPGSCGHQVSEVYDWTQGRARHQCEHQKAGRLAADVLPKQTY